MINLAHRDSSLSGFGKETRKPSVTASALGDGSFTQEPILLAQEFVSFAREFLIFSREFIIFSREFIFFLRELFLLAREFLSAAREKFLSVWEIPTKRAA